MSNKRQTSHRLLTAAARQSLQHLTATTMAYTELLREVELQRAYIEKLHKLFGGFSPHNKKHRPLSLLACRIYDQRQVTDSVIMQHLALLEDASRHGKKNKNMGRNRRGSSC